MPTGVPGCRMVCIAKRSAMAGGRSRGRGLRRAWGRGQSMAPAVRVGGKQRHAPVWNLHSSSISIRPSGYMSAATS